jgi:16S rRNA (cytosine967-C5)-methyltransferase
MARGDPHFTALTARDIAVKALSADTKRGQFVHDRLEALLKLEELGDIEASLAHELAIGVCRHRLTLDRLISAVLRGRLSSLDGACLAILRVGVYQLVWLERIPEFAVVNAAVDQAHKFSGRNVAGLVNALLRELLRHRDPRLHPEQPPDLRGAVRVDRSRWRVFDIDLLPKPAVDRAGYLSVATSHPRWLVQRWIARFGPERTEGICLSGSLRPPLVLRPNRLRASPEDLVSRLAAEGVSAEVETQSGAVFATEAPPARRIEAIAQGLCQPQDSTGQAVVGAAPPRPGQKVLDLCAAPGTKTTQLAERMRDRGLILACDRSAEKLDRIKENCRRMGISCVRLVLADDIERAADECGPFDLALVDGPCSNSGVLARRVEARYRITSRALGNLAEIQEQLLIRASQHVRRGGTMIYSTCSIEPEENEQVIQRFLASAKGWKFVNSQLTLPFAGERLTDWHDGGFVAVLRKQK